MPATMSNSRDLDLAALGDLLFVERMLSFEVLPKLLGKVHNPELTAALAEHLEQTKLHVANVEAAFVAAGAETSSNHSPPFAGLKDQHEELGSNIQLPELEDIFWAGAAVHSEHYEIAAYRTLLPLAETLAPDAVDGLRENLAQEEEAAARLEALAPELAAAARDREAVA